MSVPGLLTSALMAGNQPALPVRLQFDRMLLKANPTVEAGQRILYLEASTEVRDLQGEKVLVSALEKSIPYFLQYGRIDLDHASVLGEIRGQKVNPYAYEVGRPLDARVDGDSVWVKAAIYASTGGRDNRWTEAADLFWDSLHTAPPTPWYPSIAGDVFSEAAVVEEGGIQTQEVRGIRWHSIGLSRTPVNHKVAQATTVPMRVFAKAFGSIGDLQDALSQFVPGKFVGGLPKPKKDDPDVTAILQALSDLQPDQGLDELVAIGMNRGVPPEHTLAVLLAMGVNNSGAKP